MKFVNFAKICHADVAIVGGDVTGKALIPIIANGDGTFSAYFQDQDYVCRTKEQLDALEKSINTNGMYSTMKTKSEAEELGLNKAKMMEEFMQQMRTRLAKWIRILEERMKPENIKVFITGGNDDDPSLEDVLKSSDYVIDSEEIVVDLGGHEMISTGYGNLTPWRCPRDISEQELGAKIESMASNLKAPQNSIFNLHVPPIATCLSKCPKLDTRFSPPKPVLDEITDAGSTAVRKMIEKYQPLLSLHGHIHESKGMDQIGRTKSFNPGSEYSEGILRGIIVNLGDTEVRSHQFISG
jgi:uncharacterized protein